ncbi:MAG: hypothetical protein HYS23_10250 [Geobacter sp.]|nr:hypothetical protein [Geobacter sp.]
MDLKLDEQNLLADFRRLPSAAQQEVLDYVAFIRKKHEGGGAEEESPASDRCSIKSPEERPEAAKEPLFTE